MWHPLQQWDHFFFLLTKQLNTKVVISALCWSIQRLKIFFKKIWEASEKSQMKWHLDLHIPLLEECHQYSKPFVIINGTAMKQQSFLGLVEHFFYLVSHAQNNVPRFGSSLIFKIPENEYNAMKWMRANLAIRMTFCLLKQIVEVEWASKMTLWVFPFNSEIKCKLRFPNYLWFNISSLWNMSNGEKQE